LSVSSATTRLFRFAPAVVAAAAVCWLAAGAGAHPTAGRHALCGVELWSLKTLSDPLRYRVNLHPRNTTVAAINRLPRPYPTPKTRNTAYERRAWRVKAQIVQSNWKTTRTST
jgi:hypothetical protein